MNLKTWLAGILLLCIHYTYAQIFKNEELVISQLENDMWVVETSDKTTMYILEGTEKSLLIDTGTNCKNLKKIVRQITDKPLYVVITHVHIDHAGNLNYFDSVYFHPADTVLLPQLKPYPGKINYLADGDIFDLGNKKIEIVHMPGHTPGSIVLLDRQKGNCYSGDAFGSGQVWMQLRPHVSMQVYAQSCQRMEKLMESGISRIYCGHYPYIKRALGKNYISDMRELAEKLSDGNAPEGKAYPVKVDIGTQNPMIITLRTASIVYDPENIN
jgi:hydroxyacylglutathione hydrolase